MCRKTKSQCFGRIPRWLERMNMNKWTVFHQNLLRWYSNLDIWFCQINRILGYDTSKIDILQTDQQTTTSTSTPLNVYIQQNDKLLAWGRILGNSEIPLHWSYGYCNTCHVLPVCETNWMIFQADLLYQPISLSFLQITSWWHSLETVWYVPAGTLWMWTQQGSTTKRKTFHWDGCLCCFFAKMQMKLCTLRMLTWMIWIPTISNTWI